jgi:L-seryl-tRNA(Ser) seleniumtransferase
MTALLRHLPKVDVLLADPAWGGVPFAPRLRRREACRAELDALRAQVRDGSINELPSTTAVARAAVERVRAELAPALLPVVNATGVVLHTNLGRAPLAPAALDALARAGRYTNVEMDLDSGVRDNRLDRLADGMARVIGCGDVVVTNNCASACFLALSALAAGKRVALSRGELVEIGGSFRMPDIMAASGAVLMEIGTTNRTHLRDYERALAEGAELIMKVHQSNFAIVGFTKEAKLGELVELAHSRGVPVVYDFGAGLLQPSEAIAERCVAEALDAGVDLVLFSGDKLLGGPQAGLCAGTPELVRTLRRHPLMRMLRPGKLTLLALEATLLAWERDPSGATIPAAALASRALPELQAAADSLAAALAFVDADVDVVPVDSAVGGGTSPLLLLPSRAVRVRPRGISEEAMAAALRQGDPSVVVRREDGALLLDVRTLLAGDDARVVQAFRRL